MGWALDKLGERRCREIAAGLVAAGGGRVVRDDSGRGELISLCPLHEDKEPSFAYSYKKDLWNCSAGCGGGDLIQLYAAVEGLSNKEAFRRFKREHGTDEPGSRRRGSRGKPRHLRAVPKAEPEPEGPFIDEAELAALAELPERWLEALEQKRGWSREEMAALGLRLWVSPAGEERVAIPIRDGAGRLVNVRLYRPGAAEAKVVSWGEGFGAARLWPVEGAA